MDKTLLIRLINKSIYEKRNSLTTNDEKLYIENRMKKLNMNLFNQNQNNMQMIESLVDMFMSELDKLNKLNKSIDNDIDIKDTLINQLQGEKHNSLTTYKKAYLLLDRRYQFGNNVDEFKWNITNIATTHDTTTTAITTAANIKNITKIKVLPLGEFPYIKNVKKLSVEFIEFNTQSYILAAEKRRYHVVFNAKPILNLLALPTSLDIVDIGNSIQEFSFNQSIQQIDTLTIRFGDIGNVVVLPIDNLPGVITSLAPNTIFTFSQPHMTNIDDIIFITGTTSTNPIDIAIVNMINSPNGYSITAITPTQITIDLDISGIVGVLNNPIVYFNSKRFQIHVELTYM